MMHNRYYQYQIFSRCPNCKTHYRCVYTPLYSEHKCYKCGAIWEKDILCMPYGLCIFVFLLFILFALYYNALRNI